MKLEEKKVGEGVKFERIRRVTGYLAGDVSRFNNSKRAEERDRVKHTGLKDLILVYKYSLHPKILVGLIDVSRHILVICTSIFMDFFDKYFRTEGVLARAWILPFSETNG